MDWVDSVLEAMGFGQVFRGWIATLQRGCNLFPPPWGFPHPSHPLLHPPGGPLGGPSPCNSPGAFLVRLEAVLIGLRVANIREASFGYMDNIQVLGNDLQDIVRVAWPAGTLGLPLEPSSTGIARLPSLASAPGPAARTGLSSGS
jgi:hypothetical protein